MESRDGERDREFVTSQCSLASKIIIYSPEIGILYIKYPVMPNATMIPLKGFRYGRVATKLAHTP